MPRSNCLICNKDFYAKSAHLDRGWGKYYSTLCRSIGQRKGKELPCKLCGKMVWRNPTDLKKSKSQNFFCNKSCQTIWRNQVYSGTSHYFWRGGESTYRDRMIKNTPSPVCLKCGNNDLRVLAVHHKDYNRKNNSLDNLSWLCRNCHCLVHLLNEKI